ncbi:MAG: hypothetical protein OEZ43_05275 [Gammaproteobacteria bacterium]|nr:hypothetical protein [Gammaproteobacteria bacterium]
MTEKIVNSVGENGVNNPRDVAIVENLLEQARVVWTGEKIPRLPFTTNTPGKLLATPPLRISYDTINAIRGFQKLYGKDDGLIEPNKTTFNRLVSLNTPLKLKTPTLERFNNGAYKISYTGTKPPKPYRILFRIAASPPLLAIVNAQIDPTQVIDVTDRSSKDLFSSENLPQLLALIKKQNLWGKKIPCALYVARENWPVSISNVEFLTCPVKPISGPLSPAMGEGDTGPALKYTGNGTGRILHHEAIDGDYYFVYNNLPVIDNDKRGFDCTTYVGGIFACDASKKGMSGYGTQLAEHLGATRPFDIDAKKKDDIIKFFDDHKTGTYVMWNEGHVVLVVDRHVHEFTNRGTNNGYVHTLDIKDYPFSTSKPYWAAKITRAYGDTP